MELEKKIISIIGKSGKTNYLNILKMKYSNYIYIYDVYDIRKLSDKEITEEIKENLKLFNLDESIFEKDFKFLTKSEMKKIYLSISLTNDKDVYLIDDPTNSLDNNSINSLIKKLKNLKNKYNKTIILTSNNIEFVYKVSDFIYSISDKKIEETNSYFNNKKDIELPKIVQFINYVYDKKQIRLMARNDIKDLIKDIYRLK